MCFGKVLSWVYSSHRLSYEDFSRRIYLIYTTFKTILISISEWKHSCVNMYHLSFAQEMDFLPGIHSSDALFYFNKIEISWLLIERNQTFCQSLLLVKLSFFCHLLLCENFWNFKVRESVSPRRFMFSFHF